MFTCANHAKTHILTSMDDQREPKGALCLQLHPIYRWFYLSHWEDNSYDHYAFPLIRIQIYSDTKTTEWLIHHDQNEKHSRKVLFYSQMSSSFSK